VSPIPLKDGIPPAEHRFRSRQRVEHRALVHRTGGPSAIGLAKNRPRLRPIVGIIRMGDPGKHGLGGDGRSPMGGHDDAGAGGEADEGDQHGHAQSHPQCLQKSALASLPDSSWHFPLASAL